MSKKGLDIVFNADVSVINNNIIFENNVFDKVKKALLLYKKESHYLLDGDNGIDYIGLTQNGLSSVEKEALYNAIFFAIINIDGVESVLGINFVKESDFYIINISIVINNERIDFNYKV